MKPLLQLAWLPRKIEPFYLEKFTSINQLEKAIVEYINYYNNRRIKLKLNGLTLCNIGFRPFRLLDSKFCLTFGGIQRNVRIFYVWLIQRRLWLRIRMQARQ